MFAGISRAKIDAQIVCTVLFLTFVAGTTRCAAQQSISETSRRLQSIKVVENPSEDLPYDVPDAIVPLLSSFKKQIRELIVLTLESHPALAKPETLRDYVMHTLNDADVITDRGKHDSTDDYKYGLVQDVSIRRPSARPDLLGVVVTLRIPCGTDSSLYLFQKDGGHWKLALTHESDAYKQVSGALGGLQYSVSSSAGSKSWYAVEAWTDPWCTSVWHAINYRALSPGQSPDRPRVLFSSEHSSNISYVAHVEAQPTSFQIRFADYQQLDFILWIREHIQAYDMTRSPPQRISPLGIKPEDFFDEWLDLPWEVAARWIAPKQSNDLEGWHAKIKAHEAPNSIAIQFVRPCKNVASPQNWQIGLLINDGKGMKTLPGNVYVSISSRRPQDYIVTAIGATRPPACPGETPPVADDMDLSEN